MKQQDIQELLVRYNEGKCSKDEQAFLERWYMQLNENVAPGISSNEIEKVGQEIYKKLPVAAKRMAALNLWAGIAASIAIAIGIGFYFDKPAPATTAQHSTHDIAPGGNKAILTLSNGKLIILNAAKNGLIVNQGQTTVQKTQDGQVVYHAGNSKNTTVGYNTLSTPVGGQYRLTLSDGTIAMLDAASSIKYPVSFSGKERRVEITGQVYFEVVHNAKKPFRVITGNQIIEDIGTHFNVNAYGDETAMRTTLVEGKVAVFFNNQKAMLRPGQQAVIQQNLSSIQTKEVDADEAVAWKNGYFVFEHENIRSVMKKLSRWYNIQPEYTTGITEVGFGGTVSRNRNISEVLRILQLTGTIHFKIEGRRIKVMP